MTVDSLVKQHYPRMNNTRMEHIHSHVCAFQPLVQAQCEEHISKLALNVGYIQHSLKSGGILAVDVIKVKFFDIFESLAPTLIILAEGASLR